MTVPGSPDILLVDDNPDDVELTLRAFKRTRLANTFHVVRDGVEALDFFFVKPGTARTALPRLILLDLKLPRVSGLEVLARIRENERTRKIPVVVVTSSREEADIRRAYELGVNSYIVKPVEFEEFVAALGEVGLYWLVLNQPPV
ncbi:MAG: response regulator [Deltaproteobacteria bacterium]|nr:response regulator [Deltaproteobacteria bacterium]